MEGGVLGESGGVDDVETVGEGVSDPSDIGL